jgi:hypothetical protein
MTLTFDPPRALFVFNVRELGDGVGVVGDVFAECGGGALRGRDDDALVSVTRNARRAAPYWRSPSLQQKQTR